MRNKQTDVFQTFRRADQFHQKGDLNKAGRLYGEILAVQPSHFDALHRLGVLRYQQARNTEALDYIDAALKVAPDDVVALSNLGLVQASLGRPEAALGSYDRALALKPDHADALIRRGNALRDLRRAAEALESYDRALAFRPDYVWALNNRGLVLMDLRRPADALASYDRALALKPDYAEVLNNRGNALRDLDRLAEALASYDRALAVRPDFALALNNRGVALRDLNRPAEALADHDRALGLEPDYAEAHNNRASALKDLDRPAEALASYDRALALKPDYAAASDNKGILLTELGRFEEASSAIEWAIALAPARVRSYYNLTQCKRLAPDDPHFSAMEDLARDLPSLAVDEQIDLHFALGKALSDVGDHAESFRRLLGGNTLKRKRTVYDEAATLDVFERTRAVFSEQLMRSAEGLGEPSAVPLFIVGMPRSGTTLVEQILASHPAVFAAGETDEFARALIELERDVGGAPRFPEAVLRMSGQQFRQLGSNYIRRLTTVAPAARRITNKTPENFRFIGLIRLALPNARIIHARRDPMDTCLSCFSKLFAGNLPYTYDLAELGRYYRAYEALMAHWRSVAAQDVMLDVQYEDVVADLEGQARRIVAHCGLDWDARCLDFHLTERSVRTASATQVRQPIYSSSVGRWRAYEPFLFPLIDGLNPQR
jgi:tetratricopeptide (TPR) repeat protein